MRVIQGVPPVVAFSTDAVNVTGQVLHGVFVGPMMDCFSGKPGAADDRDNPTTTVLLPCPLTLHPHRDGEFDCRVFTAGAYGVDVVG